MVSPRVASRIAREFPGQSVDDIQNAFRGVDDTEALEFLGRVGDGPSGFRESFATRAGETFGEVPIVVADQPARIARATTEAGSSTLSNLAKAGAVGAVGWKGFEFLSDREKRMLRQNQGEALQSILDDPHISDAQKSDLVKNLIRRDFFSGGDGGEASGPLSNLFAGIGFFEAIVVLLLIWFAGKALVEATGRSA